MDYIQSKKGYDVESYFRNRKYSGAPEQSANDLVRDFEICATQLFFVNALADPARGFFLNHYSPTMPFDEIVGRMRRHYDSEN